MPVGLARAVVDTNVILSAALSPRGAPAQVLDWLLAHALLVFTDATFAELESRIWKPKFDRYLSIERRQAILHGVNVSGLWVPVPAAVSEQSFARDPTDDKFVHAALAAGPTWLVRRQGFAGIGRPPVATGRAGSRAGRGIGVVG